MILIYGSSGFIGRAVAAEMKRRGNPFQTLTHQTPVEPALKLFKPELVINCAAFIQKSSVDLNKNYPGETIMGNVVMPSRLSDACAASKVPLMHISTACLYDEKREYEEGDTPLRGFDGHCGFYVGTKLLSEQVVRQHPQHYILRIRLPFDEFDNPRNYFRKIMGFERVFTHCNSITHRGDFARNALDLWKLRAPFGIYHCVCEGQITAQDLIARMVKRGMINRTPKFVQSETVGCRLSVKKLKSVGVAVRTADEAVNEALQLWNSK
jgi:dTDP-4-dehydrorhamnose reductase